MNFEIFSIFLKFFEGSTLNGTVGTKTFLSIKSPKTRLDTWDRFGQFKNFEIFLIFFLNLFNVSSSNFKSGNPNSNFLSPENWPLIFKFIKSENPAWNTRQKNSEKSPQSMFKTRLDTFEDDFGQFGILKIFWFFLKFFKTRPSMEHGAIFFQRKCHKTCSKQVWTHLETILGFFGILNFFLKICRDSTPHGTLNNFFCRKKCPKTRLDNWERFWTISELWTFFSLFPWNFSKSLPQSLSPENRTHFFKSWKLISYF